MIEYFFLYDSKFEVHVQGVSKKTHHKDFNSFGSEIPLYDKNPAIQILI